MSTNLYTDTDRLSLSEVRHNWQHWQNTRRSTGKVPDELWQQAYDLLGDDDKGECDRACDLPKLKRLKVRFVNNDNEPDEVTIMPVQTEHIGNVEGEDAVPPRPITIKTATVHCVSIPLEDKTFSLELVHLCFRGSVEEPVDFGISKININKSKTTENYTQLNIC